MAKRSQRYNKRDGNEAEIVTALRTAGAVVVLLSDGGGVPDLLVGYNNETFLLEVKTETGKLEDDQEEWLEAWPGGAAVVVRTVDEALDIIGATWQMPESILPDKSDMGNLAIPHALEHMQLW